MSAILKISDGTTTIDLLKHFRLSEWIPSFSQYKNPLQQNPLGDYQRVINSIQENSIETFSLKINNPNTNALFNNVSILVKLLEDSTDFWVDEWATSPVYIINKTSRETNTRYAIIYNYKIPGYNNFYSQPFLQQFCEKLLEFDLVLELGKWFSDPPSVSTNLAISAYRGSSGQVNGTEDIKQIFLSNQDRDNTISYAKKYISSVFTDLLPLAAPYVLIDAGTTTGDEWYFGDESPFCALAIVPEEFPSINLIFNSMEYWNGSTWTAIVVSKNEAVLSNSFLRNLASWEPPSNWATTTVDGDTAYWVRFTVSSGTQISDIDVSEQIYIPTWASALLPEIGGTEPALGRIDIAIPNSPTSISATFDTYVNRIFLGTRGLARGENFSSYINLGNSQNPSGITITLGSDSSYVSENTAPIGTRVTYSSVTTDSWEDVLSIILDQTISPEYVGEYRAFLRLTQVGGSTSTAKFRLASKIFSTNAPSLGQESLIKTTESFAVADLGKIIIPPLSELFEDMFSELDLQIYMTSATPDFYLYDLILMPTDEWFADIIDQENSSSSPLLSESISGVIYANYLSVDSATQYKEIITASTHTGLQSVNSIANDANGEKGIWSATANGPCILQENQQQKIWTFAMRTLSTSSRIWIAKPEIIMNARVKYMGRYDAMRGSQ